MLLGQRNVKLSKITTISFTIFEMLYLLSFVPLEMLHDSIIQLLSTHPNVFIILATIPPMPPSPIFGEQMRVHREKDDERYKLQVRSTFKIRLMP